jgi:transposase-like protein
METEMPKSLHEAVKFFADPEACVQFMISVRWADGQVLCPTCGNAAKRLGDSQMWKCYSKPAHPRQKFTLKKGTIFEDSPLPLEKWMMAIWLIANCKNGISSCELARHLDITQKAAWHMDHRIRAAMRVGSLEKLAGDVEVDETFIGGKARNMHVAKKLRRITGTGGKDKVAVMGILSRGGEVRTMVVPSRKKHVLQEHVRQHVEAGSALYSDALRSYSGLANEYAHEVIDHAIAYVNGKVHTNGIENFWSLLKRSISGTYVSVEPFHLFRYLDEQSFRYNNRKLSDSDRFQIVASQVIGRRLTYSELTGKNSPAENPNCTIPQAFARSEEEGLAPWEMN